MFILKSNFIRIALIAILSAALLALSCCTGKEKKKIVVVPTTKPEVADTIPMPQMDIAMMSRSLVDALRIGEKLDSATYHFEGILTDGSGKPLYTDINGKPGVWMVEVESPNSVVLRNLKVGKLPAEDLRVYVAQAIGLSDADVIDSGIASGTDSVQAVVYKLKDIRMEMTLRPQLDAKGSEYAFVSIAFIRLKK